jgi:hypothetical protein
VAEGLHRACHEEWTAQLEDRAKPVLVLLIRGRPTRIGPGELEVIAFWALKTSLMLENRTSRAEVPAVTGDYGS